MIEVSQEHLIEQIGIKEYVMEITVLYCANEKELYDHQQELETLGIASYRYNSKRPEFDRYLITSMGGFHVKFGG